jgi:hypothetical protein
LLLPVRLMPTCEKQYSSYSFIHMRYFFFSITYSPFSDKACTTKINNTTVTIDTTKVNIACLSVSDDVNVCVLLMMFSLCQL